MKKLIYVAGPLTSSGSEIMNTRKAILAGLKLGDAGFAFIVPHLAILADMIDPHPYEWWLDIDFAIIERCDAVLVLPGESSGVRREEKISKEKGIPIYYDIDTLIEKERVPNEPL